MECLAETIQACKHAPRWPSIAKEAQRYAAVAAEGRAWSRAHRTLVRGAARRGHMALQQPLARITRLT
jgi:hypothetical protein